MNTEQTTFIMLPATAWEDVVAAQQSILVKLKELHANGRHNIHAEYISAIEFMKAVNIKRTKFGELLRQNKIKTIKKKRKVYVFRGEIERYFLDPTIQ